MPYILGRDFCLASCIQNGYSYFIVLVISWISNKINIYGSLKLFYYVLLMKVSNSQIKTIKIMF